MFAPFQKHRHIWLLLQFHFCGSPKAGSQAEEAISIYPVDGGSNLLRSMPDLVPICTASHLEQCSEQGSQFEPRQALYGGTVSAQYRSVEGTRLAAGETSRTVWM